MGFYTHMVMRSYFSPKKTNTWMPWVCNIITTFFTASDNLFFNRVGTRMVKEERPK